MNRLRGFNPLSSPSTAVISVIGVAAVVFYLSRLIASPVTLLAVVAKALGLGATYAIIALGFVLVFKATQVVNFALDDLSERGQAVVPTCWFVAEYIEAHPEFQHLL